MGLVSHAPLHPQELGELDALEECKAQMRLLPTPADPGPCGLSAGPHSWLLRRQSRALLRALQRTSSAWVPAARGGSGRPERRLRQRLVHARRRLESLQALLGAAARPEEGGGGWLSAPRPLDGFLRAEALELGRLAGALQRDLDCLQQQLQGAPPCASPRCAAVACALWTGRLPPPWRPHAPAGPQPPWLWLRQLSRRGQLLARYLRVGTQAPERVFHLSAFCHPRRLLLSLRWEAAFSVVALARQPGCPGPGAFQPPDKRQELNTALHLQVSSCGPSNARCHLAATPPCRFPPLPHCFSDPARQALGREPCLTGFWRPQVVSGPNPRAPEMGVLLIGLQLRNAEWDPLAGALQDSPSGQPSPLPPVSVSALAPGANELLHPAGLAVYSCPVYMEGPLGTTRLHSSKILMHLPLPTKLSPATCAQRRVHVCSPPLP